jgi:NAD(P)-dependent dehydrogenase (short-subunit alcohol dehydrogenase family)
MGNRLQGKRALITGGTSGIGAGIVERFRAEGAEVVNVDREGGDVTADIRDGAQIAAAVQASAERLGGLDLLVLNAGLSMGGPFADLSARGEAMPVLRRLMDVTEGGTTIAAEFAYVKEGDDARWPRRHAPSGQAS